MRTYPLKRHPNGKQLLDQLRAGQLAGNYIRPPAEICSKMVAPDLGELLTQVSGAPDGMIEGKYREAEVFVFQVGCEAIMAVTEKEERGTLWSWVTKRPKTLSFKEDKTDPKMLEFWPQFLLDLNEAMGWKLHPGSVMHPESLAYLVSKEVQLQQQALEEGVPTPPPTAPRRMR